MHYIPIHLHPYFRNLGFKKGMFPSSEQYYERALSLPIFPFLKTNQLKYIVSTIKNFLKIMNNICIIPARGGSKRIKIRILKYLMGNL